MAKENKNPLTILLIGPSGSGKGTQARLLIERLGFECIEMGKILREEAKKDTDIGRFIYKTIMVEGKLLPDDIASKLLTKKIYQLDSRQKLIIDGYPRTLNQVKDLDKIFNDLNRKNIMVFNIDVPEKITIDRLSKRLVCSTCKNNYKENGLKEGGKCPKCSGKLIKRADDAPEKVKERLEWAHKKVVPVAKEYRSRNVLYDIDGNQDLEKVYEDIMENIALYV